jgi:hypothetical protein
MKFLFILLFISHFAWSNQVLVFMDETQENHLKAYGVTYWALTKDYKVTWLLNYRGGSFLFPNGADIIKECKLKGVLYEVISESQTSEILNMISSPSQNMEAVVLEKAPKIAVYTPEGKRPWDDAVTMALTFAEIPFDKVYDEEVLADRLLLYDWLHLHHEDFTGQYGKFFGAYKNAPWYIAQKKEAEALAKKLGFDKVSDSKKAVAKKIKQFAVGGGFMFAMCAATDSFDIALAAEDTDICEPMFDGDPADLDSQNRLDYRKSIAFKDFSLEKNPNVYEFSDLDTTDNRKQVSFEQDYFILTEFSAKWDPIPTMLNQNHTQMVKGFMGQTTAFKPELLKSNIITLGQNQINGEVRYLHGTVGKGMFTFYGGHDPEDYQHRVGDAPTELTLHPSSPGYRLILNNVLFPAAEKKKQKT